MNPDFDLKHRKCQKPSQQDVGAYVSLNRATLQKACILPCFPTATWKYCRKGQEAGTGQGDFGKADCGCQEAKICGVGAGNVLSAIDEREGNAGFEGSHYTIRLPTAMKSAKSKNRPIANAKTDPRVPDRRKLRRLKCSLQCPSLRTTWQNKGEV